MNRLHLNPNYCKGCLICIDVCPKGALVPSASINAKGYALPEEGDMARCTDCGMCAMVCPDFAIAIESDRPREEP